MILAAIDGQLIILLLMAAFGFISWLSGKLNPGEKKPPQAPAPPVGAPKPRTAAESEEERMRRFLEALGMPTDSLPAPQQAPKPRPAPTVMKAPPPLPARPRPIVQPVRPPPPVFAERSLDELETTSLPVEQIVLPDLITTKIHDFATVTSTISATHEKVAASREPLPLPPTASIHQLLRASLASPQQLRSAFVLREILGPPPGLR
jgi:hypothetical protein